MVVVVVQRLAQSPQTYLPPICPNQASPKFHPVVVIVVVVVVVVAAVVVLVVVVAVEVVVVVLV